MIDPDASVAWDAEVDPKGNVRHIAHNGLTVKEVEEILFDADGRASFSRTSARPTLRVSTSAGRFLLVIFEIEARNPLTIRPSTAYEIDEGSSPTARGGIMMDHQHRRVAARARTNEERREEEQVRESVRDHPSVPELVARGDLDPDREMSNASLHELLKVTAMLKLEREARGLSLSAVARRSGLDPAALSRLEMGKNSNPTFETLSRYAAALDLDLAIGLTPRRERPPAIDLGTLGELRALVTALGPERARQRLLLIPEQVG